MHLLLSNVAFLNPLMRLEKCFSFWRFQQKLRRVKVLLIFLVLALGTVLLFAQEVTLPPIVVTGTFELRQGPSVTDLFTQHLERQIEAKRALEETAERAPWLNASFWRYLPQIQNSQVDSSQFFTPSYLTTDYRTADRALQESRKQSLFDGK
jgi:hypothetical protein